MMIYKAEKTLAKLITDNTVASVCVPVKLSEDKSDKLIESLSKIQKDQVDSKLAKALTRVVASMTKDCHPDLMYGSAILCSTVMNRNDDVFLPADTWAARNTPVNTPFNDNHVENDIIGHIIASRTLDRSGKVIPDDMQDCPVDYFDIEADFVVYKSIFPGVANDIIEKAPQGQKFVSMECRFSNFDYALLDANYNAKIIDRNEATAFLTKYLRAYGGDGYYDGMQIGRVLRNFRFSGMGSVDIPANPASEYTKLNMCSQSSLEKVESSSKVFLYMTKGTIMTIENLEQAKELIANLTNKTTQLEAELAKAQKPLEGISTIQTDLDAAKAEVSKLTNDLTAEAGKLSLAEQKVTELSNKLDETVLELNRTKEELNTKTQALNKIESDAKAVERVAKLKELGVQLNDAKREKFVAMSDEVFASVLEFAQLLPKATEQKVIDPSTVADAENKANETLDAVESNDNPGPETTAGDVTPDAEKMQKTAAKLVEALRSGRTRKDKVNKK